MEAIIILVLAALVIQAVLFFVIKKKKKTLTGDDPVLEKYNIKSKADAFKLINSHILSDGDRARVEQFYQQGY